MYFMSTAYGRPQGSRGGQSHLDACVWGGQEPNCLVAVINGWPGRQAGTAFRYLSYYHFTGAFRHFI